MSDRTKIMVVAVSQTLAARIAAELNADLTAIGIDIAIRQDPTGFDIEPEPYQEARLDRLYRSKPWLQTHPTSPKPTKNRSIKNGKRK
jgi:hypothetical protein